MLNKENVKMSNSNQEVKNLKEESKMLNKTYEDLIDCEIEYFEDYCISEKLEYDITVIDETTFDIEIQFKNEKQINEFNSLINESEKESENENKSEDLKSLMEEYDIPTFVSLARVVNCKPQYLYSRKNHKTGEYNYDSISRYLIKQYKENIAKDENITIEKIVSLASEYLKNKEMKKVKKERKNNVQKCIKQYEKFQEMLKNLNEDELALFNKTINFKELIK